MTLLPPMARCRTPSSRMHRSWGAPVRSKMAWRARRAATCSSRPKLRPIWQVISSLTWCFAGSAGWRSGYVMVSGIGAPMSWKACRWALVGSASIAMVTSVPVYRTWLRVSVARCSSRPRKLR